VASFGELLREPRFVKFRNERGDRILYQKGGLHRRLASAVAAKDAVRAAQEALAARECLREAANISKAPGLVLKIQKELDQLEDL
jgi:hypothetical protein